MGAQVAHEDVTTTNRINRIYRYVLRRRQRGEIGRRRQLAMHEFAAEVAPEGMAPCANPVFTVGSQAAERVYPR